MDEIEKMLKEIEEKYPVTNENLIGIEAERVKLIEWCRKYYEKVMNILDEIRSYNPNLAILKISLMEYGAAK